MGLVRVLVDLFDQVFREGGGEVGLGFLDGLGDDGPDLIGRDGELDPGLAVHESSAGVVEGVGSWRKVNAGVLDAGADFGVSVEFKRSPGGHAAGHFTKSEGGHGQENAKRQAKEEGFEGAGEGHGEGGLFEG